MTDSIQHEDWLAQLRERFGPDPMAWAFVCPNCGDVATGADFKAALAEHPLTRRDGSLISASEILARECIGRILGALERPRTKAMEDSREWGGRGCDWAAYGLFRGPVAIEAGDRTMYAFRMAEPVSA
jgi:hypothetical protein